MPQTQNLAANADSVSEKRRLVFGCLMQYSAESIPLRDRALEGAVLTALVGSSAEQPFKNGDVQRNLKTGNIDLRPELVRSTLDRLSQKGLVQQAEQRRKDVYHLTETGEARTRLGTSEAKSLLAPVLEEVLKHSEEVLDRTQAAAVLEDFICTSFARFGASIAGYLTGRSQQFVNFAELSVTFDEVAAKHFLESRICESLKARCMAVFRARSLEAKRLMFHLTQGYCFAQLLGVDRTDFNPIAEEAFKGSVFYFDTNVLFAGLLPGDGGDAFAEILGIAKRIGAELRVTQATIDEARHTASEKLVTLNKIAAAVPEELGELSADEFVVHFYQLRRENPTLQPSAFLAEFESIANVARDRWGITIEEMTPDKILEGADVSVFTERLQAATLTARGYKKNQRVLDHDLAHLELVRSLRETNPKTWFLTRDRALFNATMEIAREHGTEDKPLCFSVLGFLQSISPFVSSVSEENVLADFFSGLLSEQVFVSEKLFDDRELALIVEMHSDVMSMPPDQVVVAVDYIKKHILRGQRYRTEEVPTVALELRKFLSANADDRQRMLEQAAAESDDRFRAARREMMRERQLRQEYENRLQSAEETLERARSDASAQRGEVEAIQRKVTAGEARLRGLILTAASVLLGFELGWHGPSAAAWIATIEHWPWLGIATLQTALRMVKVGFFLLPLLWLIPREKVRADIRTALAALVIIAWLWTAGVQSSEVLGEIANVLAVALYIALYLSNKKD